MGILVDPFAPPPSPPASVTSPDGMIKATLDADWAGVLLEMLPQDGVVNEQDLATSRPGWAVYTAGGAVASFGGSGLRVDITTAGGSAGGTWTLPAPLPAGPVEFEFSWRADNSLDGLVGTRMRAVLLGAGDTIIATKDFPAERSASGTGWMFRTVSPIPVTKVRLYANGSLATQSYYIEEVRAATQVPYAARFERIDGSAVRGGAPAFAPGGTTKVYDHEAPLGVATAWYVVPLFREGYEGPRSDAVALTVPAPGTGLSDPSTWIKSTENPDLSMQVAIASWPTFEWNDSDDLYPVDGESVFAGYYTNPQGITTQAKFYVQGADNSARFERLLREKLLLFQTTPLFDRPSFYAVVGKMGRSDISRMEQQHYTWTVELTQVERPDTFNSSKRMPDRSFADRLNRYPTFSDVPAIDFGDGMQVV